jgi:hypothetical protein
MRKSTSPERPIAEGDAHATPIVTQPNRLAKVRHPRTYGVRPELAIPMTLSSSGSRLRRFRSSSPACALSSAPSCACRIAASPPAMMPTNWECGAAKVGGISEASKIPSLIVFVVGYHCIMHKGKVYSPSTSSRSDIHNSATATYAWCQSVNRSSNLRQADLDTFRYSVVIRVDDRAHLQCRHAINVYCSRVDPLRLQLGQAAQIHRVDTR